MLLHRNLPSSPEAFLEAVAPFREELVVAAECIFTWYWLADLCAREGIAFVLGVRVLCATREVREGVGREEAGDERRQDGQRPLEVGVLRSRRSLRAPLRRGQEAAREAREASRQGQGALDPRAQLGRAAYYMLSREKAFDVQRFAATAM